MAATAQVIPFVPAPQSIPAPTQIRQEKLAEILATRQQIASLESQLKSAESAVRQQLEAGAAVEPGLLRAALETSPRRNVAWKDVVVRLADRLGLNGEAYCSNVIEHTKPTVTTRLVVEA